MYKYIFNLVLFLATLSLPTLAQESLLLDYTIRSDFYRFEWIDYEKYEYTTDSEGRITEKIFFVKGNNELEVQYKYEYTYDQQGNLTDETELVMGEDDWSPYKRTTYAYYPDGNLSEKTLLSYVSGEWSETYRYLYNYDQNGNEIDVIESIMYGSEWTNAKRKLQEFSDGILMKTTYKKWSNEEWQNDQLNENFYNDKQEKIQSVFSFWSESNWRPVRKELFEYYDNGLLATEHQFVISGGEEIAFEIIDYQYYENDSLKSKIHTLKPDTDKDIHKTEFYYLPQQMTRIEILMFQDKYNWVMNQKKVYVYNKSGYLKAEENYGWSKDRWVDNWKRILTYDASGFIDVEDSYLYDSIGFGKSDSLKNFYQSDGFLDKQEYFRWENRAWKKYKEKEYSFDEDDHLTEIISYFVDNDIITHSIAERFEYDSNHQFTQNKIMTLEDGVWTDSLKFVYTYKNDMLEKLTSLEWNGTMWKYKKRSLYVYNANDRISYKKEQYSAGTDVWIDHIFNYYTYDDENMLTELLREFSDKPNYQQKLEYKYNGDGFITEIKHLEKHEEWSPTHTTIYEYDDNNNLIKEYEMNKSSQIYKQTDYYYDWINDVKKFDRGSADFQVFPNPFDNQLTVSFYLDSYEYVSLAIYNAQGEQVTKPISNNYSFGEHKVSINTSSLSSGVYYLSINIGEREYTQKITSVK